MNNFRRRLKRKAFKKGVEIKNSVNSLIMPFKEMPAVDRTGEGTQDRLNAHDLFSLYTADIIKKDVIFAR